MYVLGLTDGITCGASVVADGVVVAAVNDERLARLKMAYGFPRLSIAEVLRIAGITAGDVDEVRVATANNQLYDGLRPFDGWMASDKGFMRNAVFAAVSRRRPVWSPILA